MWNFIAVLLEGLKKSEKQYIYVTTKTLRLITLLFYDVRTFPRIIQYNFAESFNMLFSIFPCSNQFPYYLHVLCAFLPFFSLLYAIYYVFSCTLWNFYCFSTKIGYISWFGYIFWTCFIVYILSFRQEIIWSELNCKYDMNRNDKGVVSSGSWARHASLWPFLMHY